MTKQQEKCNCECHKTSGSVCGICYGKRCSISVTNAPSHRQEWLESILDDLDIKLEHLFNLGGWALLAYLRKEITKEERTALLEDWNVQGREYMREAILSIRSADIAAFRGMIGAYEEEPVTGANGEYERNCLRKELTQKLQEYEKEGK